MQPIDDYAQSQTMSFCKQFVVANSVPKLHIVHLDASIDYLLHLVPVPC